MDLVGFKGNNPMKERSATLIRLMDTSCWIAMRTVTFIVVAYFSIAIASAGEVKRSLPTLSDTKSAAAGHQPATHLPKRRVLNVPSALPSALPPVSNPEQKATPVTFRTLVSGPAQRPEVLLLDEVSRDGTVIKQAVADLRDNGKDPDHVSGDGFYASVVAIASPTETEKYYRLRDSADDAMTSGIMTFPITKLPLKARPSDPKTLVDDLHSSSRVYSNEVIVAARVGVSPRRIQEIVEVVGHELQETISIVGFLPALDLYLVEIEGDKTAEGIHRAIEVFSAHKKEVKDATPNFKRRGASAGAPSDNYFPPCTSGSFADCQHYMQTIRADLAWDLLEARAGGTPTIGSPMAKVVVIDNGINFSHDDLDGQRDTVTEGDNAGGMGHGTAVAGLIAAKHNNGGIAGVAPDTKLIPYNTANSWTAFQSFLNAVSAEAKIINYSYANADYSDMRSAICHAICSGRLVVVPAGNACTPTDLFPAAYNDGIVTCACSSGPPIIASDGLLVVGAIDIDWDDNGAADTTGVIAKMLDGNCSNVQPWVDIYAPGEQIKTTTVINPPYTTSPWSTVDGTSYATPLVAGAAAVVWGADPLLANTQVEERLRERGQPLDLAPAHQVHPYLTGKTEAQILALVAPVGGPLPRVLDLFAALNQAPAAANSRVSTREDDDVPYVFKLSDFNFSDADGDNLNQIQVTTLESEGSLKLGGNDVTHNKVINIAQITGNQLTFIPANNANGVGYDSFNFRVHDGMLYSDSSYTMTIDVTQVNDPPNGTDNTVEVPAGAAYTFESNDFGFIDPNDNPSNALNAVKITSLPTTGTLTNNNMLVSSGQSVSILDIEADKLVYTPPTDVSGVDSTSFTFRVQDDGGTTNGGVNLEVADNTFTINLVTASYEIVFVLDRSGSMARHVDLGDSTSSIRWDALRKAVVDSATLTGFVTEIVDANSGYTSRFGMSLFATKVITPDEPEPFTLHDIDLAMLSDVDASLANKVGTELNSQSPFGSTAMGLGLQRGETMLDNCNRPRIIVLFSDGEQNQGPRVKTNGTGYESPVSDINTLCTGAGVQKVEIVSIGIMNSASSAYYTTLQNLAKENGDNKTLITSTGTSFDVPGGASGVDLDTAFTAAIVDALSGNSPQLIASYRGDLSNPVTLPGFMVNRHAKQLILKLTYNRKFKRSDLMALYANTTIMRGYINLTSYFEPVIADEYTDTLWLRTTFTLPSDNSNIIEPAGEYILRMDQPDQIQGDLKYRAVAFVDDHRFDIDWSVNPPSPKADSPFSPTVQLSWSGQPVTNATVTALILKPGDDLGDLLAKNPQTIDPSKAPDAGSPGDQKLRYLLEHAPEFAKKLLPSEQRLTLTHQGNGRYSVAYHPGNISGVYQIVYYVTAANPDMGRLQRSTVQSVYTRFGDIDMGASDVVTKSTDRGISINFRPKTTNGRFIGPAQSGALTVEGDGISLSNITDHQDGSYTLVLTGDPDTEVVIQLLGERIYQGPASRIERGFFGQLSDWLGGLGFPDWLIWLLTMAILLLLIWPIWRFIVSSST